VPVEESITFIGARLTILLGDLISGAGMGMGGDITAGAGAGAGAGMGGGTCAGILGVAGGFISMVGTTG